MILLENSEDVDSFLLSSLIRKGCGAFVVTSERRKLASLAFSLTGVVIVVENIRSSDTKSRLRPLLFEEKTSSFFVSVVVLFVVVVVVSSTVLLLLLLFARRAGASRAEKDPNSLEGSIFERELSRLKNKGQ